MWFSKKKEINPDTTPLEELVPTLDLSTTTRDRVEIQVAKDASAEAKAKVKQVNAHFNDLVTENGFHVKIYIAAGGTPKGRKQ